MSRDWPLVEAGATDAVGIASLFAQSWRSPFSFLQFGNSDLDSLTTALAPRIAQQMKLAAVSFVVVRNPATKEVVAVAQWTLPTGDDLNSTQESPEDQDERQALEDEVFRKNLPANSNKDLIMDFTTGLRDLRQRILQGQRHYLLDNLATHPAYQRQGLARRLIEQVLQRADADDVPVYLETASDNPAGEMYRRLGFEEQGQHVMEDLGRYATREELQQCGGISTHTHVAFVRGRHGGSWCRCARRAVLLWVGCGCYGVSRASTLDDATSVRGRATKTQPLTLLITNFATTATASDARLARSTVSCCLHVPCIVSLPAAVPRDMAAASL